MCVDQNFPEIEEAESSRTFGSNRNCEVDDEIFGAKLFRTPSIRKGGYPCFKYINNQAYLRQGAISKQAIPIAVLHSLIDHPCNS